MIIDRRAFVAGATLLTVAPALALLPVPSSAAAANARRIIFRIDGWSIPGDSDSADEVWIRVDRSWRTAWR
jgi:hypothetical protein